MLCNLTRVPQGPGRYRSHLQGVGGHTIDTAERAIFVAIAAYRDPDLMPTIKTVSPRPGTPERPRV
jgi:hypothetical protein